MNYRFLPTTKREMKQRGWQELDFIIISGDAYADHPSFGPALIGRILEAEGRRVGIIPQPDWRHVESFRVLGKPALAFLITSGNVDSMVNHYTANRRPRREDAYSPGGRSGKRPDRAILVYTGMARQAYKGVPVIIGGLEASLRRLSHYDYWSDSVRRPVIADAKADLLVYGMGERQIMEAARRLASGEDISGLNDIRGTVFRSPASAEELTDPANPAFIPQAMVLPGFEAVREDKQAFLKHTRIQYRNTDPITAKPLIEPLPQGSVVQNPPALPLSPEELDRIYELPFTRNAHPSYTDQGGIPALQEVRFSLASSRGCFGDCSFCSLTFHQGRHIQARTKESLVREAETLTGHPEFKGSIHDVGGPTANFRIPACRKQETKGTCPDRQCLYPEPCPAMKADHSDYVDLLKSLRGVPGIKNVFIRSGIRYDYLEADPSRTFLRELCAHHVSGQLKVAPEHVSPEVLERMGKPSIGVYDAFRKHFSEENRRLGKKQYILPYFISAHPGSDLKAAVELAVYLKKTRFIPQQVQDFYPTPGTLSTCMYYTGIDPRNGEKVYVPRSERERGLQRALLQFNDPRNRKKVREALRKAGRTDLIGKGKNCLVP
ncbi:MAG: YgiQ family radical SAM protein [Spirochaetia bacterium]